MRKLLKRMSSARIIALGFAAAIFIGSGLLMLPCSVRNSVDLKYIDALYTSASAVCVTGLVTVDIGDTFTAFGQFVVAALIQIGGLGVASMGAGVILAVGKRINLKGRRVLRDAMNLDSGKGIVKFIKSVFLTTAAFELVGAALSFIVFVRDYPPLKALGISLFHSVAAFNNSGFDILGNFQSLSAYKEDVFLNLVTCLLIFFGGIGFLVIREIVEKRFRWRRFSMHTKVVLTMSVVLTVGGAVIFRITEDMPWIGALFNSVTARTAGFSTYSLGEFSNAGLLAMIFLMFVGASPGSTGGGIKTSTLFALIQGIKTAATNTSGKAFHSSVPHGVFRKASVIAVMGISVIAVGTFMLCAFEPDIAIRDALFEMTSAFGTVGLTTGITTGLCTASKLTSIVMMYIGRLGPLTIATLWYFTNGDRIKYPDGNIAIG